MINTDPIRKVVVVGGSTAGWMAAAVLSEMFKGLLEVELVESDDIAILGIDEASIPQVRAFTELLHVDEAEFLKRTRGTFKLGTRFTDWGQLGAVFMHAFGSIGMKLGPLEFHHYWLKARAAGQADQLWKYSLNETAALANRFKHLDHIPDTHMDGLRYAYHFDAVLFAAFLREYSEKRGVRRTEGKVVDVKLDGGNGFIESVLLEGGRQVVGDLYIDCTGLRGLLIEEALETGYEDWSLWLPCDRAIVVPSARSGPIKPFSKSRATSAGWQWCIPLQHREGNGHVFSSQYMDGDEALSLLLKNIEGEPLDEPKVLNFKNGRRKKFWNRNCVALGRAGGFLEPLESTCIHLVETGISRLLEYFPRKGFDRADIDEFNRRCTWEFERIRDFLILHYHANQRTDSQFWIDRREIPVPAELHRRTDLFSANGRIHCECDEPFAEVAWLQVMIGQGLMPAGWHPLADRIDEGQMGRFLTSIQTTIGSNVDKMPAHEEFIGTYCKAG